MVKLFISSFTLILLIHSNRLAAQNLGIILPIKTNSTLTILEGDFYYTTNTISYHSRFDSSKRAGIIFQQFNHQKQPIAEVLLTSDDLNISGWKSEPADLLPFSKPFRMVDSICIVFQIRMNSNKTFLCLVKLLNMKLVSSVKFVDSENAQMSSFSTLNNVSWMSYKSQFNENKLIRIDKNGVHPPFNIATDINMSNQKILQHPSNTFIILSFLEQKDYYIATVENRFIQKYSVEGALIWERKIVSETFINLMDFAFLDDDNIISISQNYAYLSKKNPSHQDLKSTSINPTPHVIFELFSSTTGATSLTKDVTTLLRSKLALTPLHKMNPIIMSVKQNTSTIVLTYGSSVSQSVVLGHFFFDKNLNYTHFQSYDKAFVKLDQGRPQIYSQYFQTNGSLVFVGSSLPLDSNKRVTFLIYADSNGCIEPNCVQVGCSDIRAYNYDPKVVKSDNSCRYSQCNGTSDEYIFTTPHGFEFIDGQKGRQGAMDVMTITGANDNIIYLQKTMGAMCKVQGISGANSQFSSFYQRLCLPRSNPCYRVQFAHDSFYALYYDLNLQVSINDTIWSSLHVTKDFTLTKNQMSYTTCTITQHPKTFITNNPTHDSFGLHRFAPASYAAKFELYDLTGTLLLVRDLQNKQTIEISLIDLPCGVYIGRINSIHGFENGNSFKIIKY